MAHLSVEYKQGNEGQNKKLFKSIIETSWSSINHLPGSFNDEVISSMFLDVDRSVISKTAKEYYSTKLRSGPEDSALLKSYVSLNSKVYKKFNRMLYYLLWDQVFATIKSVQKLKLTMLKWDYTTITRTIVNMAQVTKKTALIFPDVQKSAWWLFDHLRSYWLLSLPRWTRAC